MFKNLILASATAAVALTAAADFSAGTFDMTAAAEARSVGVLAQTTQPSKPTRVGPAIPGKPGDLKSTQTDLFPTPLFPGSQDGLPGHYYCAGTHGSNQKSNAVSVVVNSQGTKAPGPVEVIFEFSGGKKVRQKVVLNSPNDAKGAAAYIPDNAWIGGKVSYTIRVDYQNKIPETNENNNVVQSFCIDPAG